MGACCSSEQHLEQSNNNNNKRSNEQIADNERKCTDPCWAILFAICWIVILITASWSFIEGNPSRIIHGYDSFGNICGQKNVKIQGISWSGIDMRKKPYVFHLNPQVGTNQTMKICVSKCADQNITSEEHLRQFYQRTQSSLFRYDYDIRDDINRDIEKYYKALDKFMLASARSKDEFQGFGPGPKIPIKKQRPLLNRCVDTERIIIDNSLLNSYSKIKNLDISRKIVSDIYTSWKLITATVLFGIFISIIIAFTIHFVASLVSTLIMIVATLSLILLTAFSWYVWFDMKYKIGQIPFNELLDDDLINEKTFMLFSIILTIITIIILIVAFAMRSRLALMVALFDETAKCLRSMPALIFQPLWTATALLLFLAFWTTIFLAISTAEDEVKFNSTTTRFKLALPARGIDRIVNGEAIFSAEANQYTLESVKHDAPKFVKYLWWFLILMLFWSSEFILGCQQMTVASSVASWYFTRDRTNFGSPILSSICRIRKFHVGSIACGSFLIVLFKIPRLILAYFEYILNRYKDSNSCVSCTLKCCHFTWYCLENFIRYVNHNAYTIIAIEGTNYCFSAQVAFKTITANSLRIVAINTMGDFIIFLGKVIVTGAAGFFGILIMRNNSNINYLAVPVLFATILTYFVAHAMLSVYEMVIDTMFLCFVEDVNKNANTGEGYYAPEGLMKFAKEDGKELKGGVPMIAQELNNRQQPAKGYPLASPAAGDLEHGRPSAPPLGFNYPPLVESSH